MKAAIKAAEKEVSARQDKVSAFMAEKLAPLGVRKEEIERELEKLRGFLEKVAADGEPNPATSEDILAGSLDSLDEQSARNKTNSLLRELNDLEDQQRLTRKHYQVLAKDLESMKMGLSRQKAELYHEALKKALRKAKPELLRLFGLAALYRAYNSPGLLVPPNYDSNTGLVSELRAWEGTGGGLRFSNRLSVPHGRG